MLTIKYIDNLESESIHPDITQTSWHFGCLTGQLANGGSVSFGPFYRDAEGPGGPNPVAFVMNERGATVARYEFWPTPMPQELLQKADEKLAA